jgi:hypothetical protein
LLLVLDGAGPKPCRRRKKNPPEGGFSVRGRYFALSLFFDLAEGQSSAAKLAKASGQLLLLLQSQQPDLLKSAMLSPPLALIFPRLTPAD